LQKDRLSHTQARSQEAAEEREARLQRDQLAHAQARANEPTQMTSQLASNRDKHFKIIL